MAAHTSSRSLYGRSQEWQVLRLAYVLTLLGQCLAEHSHCSRYPRTMFTLDANASQPQYYASLHSIRSSGYVIVQELRRLRMIIACAPAATNRSKLENKPNVPRKTPGGILAIERDGNVNAARDAKASWALDRIDQPALPLDGFRFDPRNCSRHLGEVVDVFVIDTGCRVTHSAFASARIRTIPAPGSPFSSGADHNGHGTAVASLVVGRDTGAAPRANVTCVKAMGDNGKGKFSIVIAALELAVEASAQARERGTFAVLSLTGRAPARYTTMDEAVKRAAAAGVVTFAAAGNQAEDACQFTPGRNSYAVSIAATDRRDRVARFSNTGRCVDAAAPGTAVLTAAVGGDHGYKRWDGTSFATPLVAGVVALVWQGGGGGKGETEAARRVIAKLSRDEGAGYRMPTLDGRCHSGRSYEKGQQETLGLTCGGALGAAVVLVALTARWRTWRWGKRASKEEGEPRSEDDLDGTAVDGEV